MTREEISRKADMFFEGRQTRDLFAVCRDMGITVVFVPLTVRVRAFYQCIRGVDVIYLSEGLSDTEQYILLAHELGHFVLHRGVDSFFIARSTLFPPGRFEREADEFARCLLGHLNLDLTEVAPDIRRILSPDGM